MSPRFLIPSLLWYGAHPLVPDQPTGMPRDQKITAEDVKYTLFALDSLILLLNLAGYQVRTVAFAIGSAPVSAANVVAVDLATMGLTKGTGLDWTTPSQLSVIGLWIERRYPLVPAEASAVCPLDGLADPDGGSPSALEETFTTDGTGWLRFLLGSATSWKVDLLAPLALARARIIANLASNAEAAREAAPDSWVCGLLSMLDPARWAPSASALAGASDVGPMLERMADRAFAEPGLAAFLEEETSDLELGGSISLSGAAGPSCADRLFEDALDGRSYAVRAEELAQALDAVHYALTAAGEVPPFTFADFRALSATRLWLYWQERGAIDFLSPIEEQFSSSLYGGYDLRIGDSDATRVWGGLARSQDVGDEVPADGQPGYVAALRNDLASFGFGPIIQWTRLETSATFTDQTAEAVRELQLHAKVMPNLATPTPEVGPFQGYGDGLVATPNPHFYRGPVSGVVNVATRQICATWRERTLRCPVIVEAWHTENDAPTTRFTQGSSPDNLWRSNQMTSDAPRVFVRDLSGLYPIPATKSPDAIVLGEYQPIGPISMVPRHVWWSETGADSTEITPQLFGLGDEAAIAGTAASSTFRVIRAVSEEECAAYLDCMNAWDTAVLSCGCYHWTICLLGAAVEEGELAAYFAYLKGRGAAGDTAAQLAFENCFRRFGCDVGKRWNANTSRRGTPCWMAVMRKYVAPVQLENEDGGLVSLKPTDKTLAGWFRGWHWFYRIQMALRTDTTFRARMWDYARLRVRDLLAAPWGRDAPWGGPLTHAGNPATLGDLFTSELAVAMLVRWHVWKPAHVVEETRVAVRVANVLSAALGGYTWPANLAPTRNDTATWTGTEEGHLIDAIYAARTQYDNAGTAKDESMALTHVHGWPTWSADDNFRRYRLDLNALQPAPEVVGLSRERDSFELDSSDLPAAQD